MWRVGKLEVLNDSILIVLWFQCSRGQSSVKTRQYLRSSLDSRYLQICGAVFRVFIGVPSDNKYQSCPGAMTQGIKTFQSVLIKLIEIISISFLIELKNNFHFNATFTIWMRLTFGSATPIHSYCSQYCSGLTCI